MFQRCFKGVSKMFQRCFRGKFIAGFKVVTRLIQEDSLCVPRMSVWCSMGALWVYNVCKECLKGVQKLVKRGRSKQVLREYQVL